MKYPPIKTFVDNRPEIDSIESCMPQSARLPEQMGCCVCFRCDTRMYRLRQFPFQWTGTCNHLVRQLSALFVTLFADHKLNVAGSSNRSSEQCECVRGDVSTDTIHHHHDHSTPQVPLRSANIILPSG